MKIDIEWIDNQLPELEQRLEQLAAEYNRTRGMRDMLLAQKEAMQREIDTDTPPVEEVT